jgi:ribosome-associated protein
VALTTKKSSVREAADKPKKAKTESGASRAAATAKRSATAARPKIRASHATLPDAPRAPRRRTTAAAGASARRAAGAAERAPREPDASSIAEKAGRAAPVRKSPLAGPKRAAKRVMPESPPPEPSAAARELAIGLATAGIEKKAIGIEILDVTGKVDYADFLVVMTGRSDRHVHAIATGIEEAMRRKKAAPLSTEGLGTSTWVLIDFGDVVVHVFQEEARLLYDIEGLWIDAGRVPVPAEGPGALPAAPLPEPR